MKLAIISPFPPSKVTLSEYGFHLVKHFANKDEISEIVVLTNHLEDNSQYQSDDKKVKLMPCWGFNSLKNIYTITKTIKQEKPDIILFNLQFMLFGDNKIAAALGLMLPALFRLIRIPTVTLLHNIMEEVDLGNAGFTTNPILKNIYRFIGEALTRLILFSDIVGVTIEKYVETLRNKYNANHVVLLPHGTFEIPEEPDFNKRTARLNVMTFGKFGTYKKIEGLIEAVQYLRDNSGLSIELVVAGTDNPNVKGYLKQVKEQYNHVEGLTFTGYVAEEDVPGLFTGSTVVVFPYTSTTGSSGVLHQAGSYGKAVVLPKIGDLERLIETEGYEGSYFEPNDIESMAGAIGRVLTDAQYRKRLEYKNYQAAISLDMADITDWYLLHFNHLRERKGLLNKDTIYQSNPVSERQFVLN